MKETNVDCMKYRKSTHLAGADVLAMTNKVVKIKECYYSDEERVNGKILDGYYIEFHGIQKRLKLNTVNKKRVASIVRKVKSLGLKDSRNISNWNDVKIELYFDESVSFARENTGGIRVSLNPPKIEINDSSALSKLKKSKNSNELKNNWLSLTKEERLLNSVKTLKEKLKNDLLQ